MKTATKLALLKGVGVVPPSDVAVTRSIGTAAGTDLKATGVSNFGTWLGRAATHVLVFNDHTNGWGNFVPSVDEQVTNYPGLVKVWTIGLTVVGTALSTVAAGTYDSYFTTAASHILADAPVGSSQIIIRLGHEFNTPGGYPWASSGVESNFIAAFRRVVGLFRAVSTRFRFDWCFAQIGGDPTSAYPGDAYVDIIGADYYYLSTSGDGSAQSFWDHMLGLTVSGYASPNTPSLTWHAAFAALHRKPMSYPEFGCNWDKPIWMDHMGRWIAANNVAYASLWDNNDAAAYQCRLSDGNKPYTGYEFIQQFGVPGALPTNLFASGTDFTTASWSRTNVTATAGATDLSGGTTAQAIRETAATGSHVLTQNITKAASTKKYQFLARVKPQGRTHVVMAFYDTASGYANSVAVDFDLSGVNGAPQRFTGGVNTFVSDGANPNQFVTCFARANGYYEIKYQWNCNAATAYECDFSIYNDLDAASYLGVTSKGVDLALLHLREIS